ncbi:MAG TPA: vitamin K epoxide reductase family protein [Candidatus Dormibacteraeota bacterium]|nr:vitamin K epoxide reductase family protein [Candidatus Dormibacteraeota bacterium]
MGRDRLLLTAAALAGVVGIAISAYLTVVHYSALPLVCTTTGIISCERVFSSPYSVIAGSGLPTSAAGIVWFSVSAGLAAVQLTGRTSSAIVRWHLLWSAVGLATVVYLVFLEIVQLGAICIWCSSAHALVVMTFLIALTRMQAAAATAD